MQAMFVPGVGTVGFQLYNSTGSAITESIPFRAVITQFQADVVNHSMLSQPSGVCGVGSGTVWASNNGDDTIQVFTTADGTNYACTGTYSTHTPKGSSPGGLCYGGTSVFLGNGGRGFVTQFNTAGTIIRELPASGYFPNWTEGNPSWDGTSVWIPIANQNSNNLFQYDQNGNQLAVLSVNGSPNSSYFDGTYLWVYSEDGYLSQVDVNSRAVNWSYQIGQGSGHNAITGVYADGATVWVTNGLSNNVITTDYSGNVTGTISGFNDPDGIARGAGNDIWVGNNSSNTLSIIERDKNVIFGTYVLGSNSYNPGLQLYFDGTWIWSPNYNFNENFTLSQTR
jgi:hypothetical protein